MSASTAAPQIQEGDKVSWNWGSGNPSGVASEVKAGDVTVTSHRGNDITKHGSDDNPAVHIERPGNDVVKKASELTVEENGKPSNGTSEEKKEESNDQAEVSKPEEKEEASKEESKDEAETEEKPEEKKDNKTNGKASKVGEKRSADKKDDAPDSKKQKTNGAADGEKKRPGRPKGNGPKKEKKVPAQGTRKSTRGAAAGKNYEE